MNAHVGNVQQKEGDANHLAFGQSLRSLRQQRGLDQSVVASQARLAPSYLSGIERCQRPAPARHIVQRLTQALQLSSAEAQALIDEAQSSREAWQHRARDLRSHSRSGIDLRTGQVIGCLQEAMKAMRQGWCMRLEVCVPTEGAPFKVTLWRNPDPTPQEATM